MSCKYERDSSQSLPISLLFPPPRPPLALVPAAPRSEPCASSCRLFLLVPPFLSARPSALTRFRTLFFLSLLDGFPERGRGPILPLPARPRRGGGPLAWKPRSIRALARSFCVRSLGDGNRWARASCLGFLARSSFQAFFSDPVLRDSNPRSIAAADTMNFASSSSTCPRRRGAAGHPSFPAISLSRLRRNRSDTNDETDLSAIRRGILSAICLASQYFSLIPAAPADSANFGCASAGNVRGISSVLGHRAPRGRILFPSTGAHVKGCTPL